MAKRRWRDWLLTVFGDIKVFRWPMFAVYDPGSYRVKGDDTREVLELVQPGDVLVRGYTMYLDGKFIPGYFSHAGLYLGKTTEAERLLVTRDEGKAAFRAGEQMVIHAIAEGVRMEDVLDFCRCDRLVILRFPGVIRLTPGLLLEPDGILDEEERALRDRLAAGDPVPFVQAWPVVRRVALAQLGRDYDFDFDFSDVNRFSCTELVHRATRALGPFLKVKPERHRILFLQGSGIAPDAFVASPLRLVWQSRSVDPDRVRALRGDRGDDAAPDERSAPAA